MPMFNLNIMPEMISAKIDVKKIDKNFLYVGQKGTYLDVTLIPNRDGDDQCGNAYFIAQSISREARDRGEKGPIIGNAKIVRRGGQQQKQQSSGKKESGKKDDGWIDEEADPF